MNIPIAKKTDDEYIFLSYALEDKEKAVETSFLLSKAGYHAYMDNKNKENSQTSMEMLESSKLFLYYPSPECQNEWEKAKELAIPTIDLSGMAQNVLPEEIKQHGLKQHKNPCPNLQRGSLLRFGRYKQDNFVQPIEWSVLDIHGDNALLISKYALDCQRYNTHLEPITWETCSLRRWLNEDFCQAAFNEKEKSLIQTAFVKAEDNIKFDTPAGNDTIDTVFLLSIEEAQEYFADDEERICRSTLYAEDHGSWNGTSWWWLRSPGINPYYAASVRYDGSLYRYGDLVSNDYVAVRQSLWINLQSGIF